MSANDFFPEEISNEPQQSSVTMIPVIEEFLSVEKKRVEAGIVTVTKKVEEKIQPVDINLTSDEYTIEHVDINQFIDEEPPRTRQEGDTLILPVVEEVIVKRLRLVKEIRITKKTTERNEQQDITLRKETVTITRTPVI